MSVVEKEASTEAGAAMPAAPPRENLYRATQEIGLDRSAGTGMPSLVGHFAVWDQWTEIRSAYEGNFMERFSPSSMSKTLSESRPKVLFNHGKDPQIGDKVLGSVRSLTADNIGAAYEVPLLDTSYNRDLIPGIEAGVYGASFRFKVLKEEFVQRPKRSEFNPRGIPERTVTEAQVAEFGPVTFPAYLGATAGLRSMTDEFLFDVLVENPDRLRDLCRRTGISLNGVKTPAPNTTSTGRGITININGAEARFDAEDVGTLAQMVALAAEYIDEQDETNDAADITAMQGVVVTLTNLLQSESAEIEPAETDEQNSALAVGEERTEPESPETTTPVPGTEPESSAATTHSNRGLFWFADPPAHLRSK